MLPGYRRGTGGYDATIHRHRSLPPSLYPSRLLPRLARHCVAGAENIRGGAGSSGQILMANINPKDSNSPDYTVTLKSAEWAALCICANHGATSLTSVSQHSRSQKAQAEDIQRYSDAAVKVIHGVLRGQGGATAQSPGPSADASDDTPGAAPLIKLRP